MKKRSIVLFGLVLLLLPCNVMAQEMPNIVLLLKFSKNYLPVRCLPAVQDPLPHPPGIVEG